jgi:hypothetical protein
MRLSRRTPPAECAWNSSPQRKGVARRAGGLSSSGVGDRQRRELTTGRAMNASRGRKSRHTGRLAIERTLDGRSAAGLSTADVTPIATDAGFRRTYVSHRRRDVSFASVTTPLDRRMRATAGWPSAPHAATPAPAESTRPSAHPVICAMHTAAPPGRHANDLAAEQRVLRTE